MVDLSSEQITLELFKRIDSNFGSLSADIATMRQDVSDMRERLIRLESQDFLARMTLLEAKIDREADRHNSLQLDFERLKTKTAPIFGVMAVIGAAVASVIAGKF